MSHLSLLVMVSEGVVASLSSRSLEMLIQYGDQALLAWQYPFEHLALLFAQLTPEKIPLSYPAG